MSLITKHQLGLSLEAVKNLLSFKADKKELDTKIDRSEFSYEEIVKQLAEADMLLAVHDEDNAILTDENGNVILRY